MSRRKSRGRAGRRAQAASTRPAQVPKTRAARQPNRKLWWVAGAGLAAVIATLVVVATQRSAAPRAGAKPASAASDAVAGAFPRFRIADVRGRELTRPGGKPGLLIFTASYCKPCISQAPGVVRLKRRLGAGVEMLTLSVDPRDSAAAMAAAFGPIGGNTPGYELAVDRAGTLAPAFGVTSLGTEVVYDRRGREVWRGVLSPVSEIAAALQRAGA